MMRFAFVLLTGCSFMFTNTPKAGERCNSSEASPIADGALAVLVGLTTIGLVADATDGSGDGEAVGVALASGGITALFASSAVVGFGNVGKCRRQEKREYEEALAAQQSRATTQVPASRKDAWTMTKQAQIAARAGDCETVATYDQVVASVDPEFHRSVFSRDAAIVRCLSSREIPVEPPTPTPAAAPPTAAPPSAGSAAPAGAAPPATP